MEKFKLSEKAIKAIEEEICFNFGEDAEEARGNIYEKISDAAILLGGLASNNPSGVETIADVIYFYKLTIDNIFEK